MAETISIDIQVLQGIFGDLTRVQQLLGGLAGPAGNFDQAMAEATAGVRQSLGGVTGAVNNTEAAMDTAMRGMVGDIMEPVRRTQELNDKLARLGREMNTAKSVNEVSRLKKEIKATQKELDGVNTGGMERRVSGGVSRMRGVLGSLVAPIASVFAVGAIKNFVGGVVEAVGAQQQFGVAMRTIIGDKAKADTMMADVKEFAANTPFDLAQTQKAATQMLGMGFSAESVIPAMQQLGDVAAGLGQPMGDLAYLYATTRAQGKMNSTDLMQFANRGIPIIEELSKVLKTSQSNVKQMVEDGSVNFSHLQQVFANMTGEGGKFHNLMEGMNKTIAGKLGQVAEAWQEFKTDLGEAFEPEITRAVDFLREAMERLGRSVGKIRAAYDWVIVHGQAIKDVIAGLTLAATAYGGILFWNNRQLVYNNALKAIAVVRDGAMALWTGLTTTAVAGATTAQWSWNAALLANPIGIVIGVLAALVGGVIWAWNRFEGFRAFLYGLWAAVKSVFFGIKDIVTKVFGALVDIVAGFGKTLIGAITLDPALVKEGIMQGAKGIRDAMSATDDIKSIGWKAGLAYAQGDAEGRASFRADHKSGTTNALDAKPGDNVGAAGLVGGPAAPGADADGGKGSTVGGKGGGDRNIAMNITMNMQFGIGRDVQASARDTAEQVVAMITNKLRDAQFALG
ncbi:MAG: hypothetical protein JSR70_00930 [Proteobacteria bacterium]|nr:hypothetical protein [Pseudomonadota bacterium]